MLKALALFIFISISASAWAFYPPSETSEALYSSLKGKGSVSEDFLKEQITNANSYNSGSNYEVRMTKIPKVEGQPPAEWVPVMDNQSKKLIVELRITEEGLKSPLVMAEEIVSLNTITSNGFIHPYEWAETVANAKAGSIRATEKLARIELSSAKAMSSWLETNINFFEDGTDPVKVQEWAKLRLAEAQKRYDPILKAAKAENKRLLKEWSQMKPTFNELERQDKKFNDFVMANDRTGARKMIEQYMPWPLMEPSEKNTWKQWLDAMENPDLSRRQLVFRGMDGYPVLKTPGSPKVGMFSSLLAMNQGNYTRRLRSLTTSRNKVGRYSMYEYNATSSTEIKNEPSLITQMKSHAGSPQASPFISVSDNSVASRFGSQERMALLVDERRLVPNAMAFGFGEKERLIPLVVFPEEVVYYQTQRTGPLGTIYIDEDAFLAKVSEEIGRPVTPEEINLTMIEEDFNKKGFDSLSTSILQTEGASLSGAACIVGMPCDCIKKGFEKLLSNP